MKKYIAISGSLRKDSYNTRLLHEAIQVAPEGMEIEMYDIHSLPLYNQDLEDSFPIEAKNLKDAIELADGIIFVTPEHNRSIPAALKNVIDWGTRPSGKNSFLNKTTFVMGASSGLIGTAVAQIHLKQIMLHLGAKVIGKPEFHLSNVQEKFNEAGELTDEKTKEYLRKALEAVVNY